MTKLSSKNGIVLLGGYKLSSDLSAYTIDSNVAPVDVTGFGEPQNFTPGLVSGEISATAYWNAANINSALSTIPGSTHVTIIPEGSTRGNNTVSMACNHTMWMPQGTPDSAITAGTIQFSNRGTSQAIEHGWLLNNSETTNTLTTSSVLDPTDDAATAVCSGTLHIWTACASDTYTVVIEDSPDDSTWDTLITFTLDGSAIGSERISVASGTINKYRRVVATRTGAAGDIFGFSVHFWRAEEV